MISSKKYVDETLRTAISYASFMFLPAIMKGDMKNCGIVYTVHLVAQALSLMIRELPLYLATNNFLTVTLLAIDMYFWLILFYVIFNYKKEK